MKMRTVAVRGVARVLEPLAFAESVVVAVVAVVELVAAAVHSRTDPVVAA